MRYLTVRIENLIPYDADNFNVSYSFYAVPLEDPENPASGNGDAQFPVATLSSVVNSSIIDICVARALEQGVTIEAGDRKIVYSGLN